MKNQLVTLMVACGFLVTGAQIQAQDKMGDKASQKQDKTSQNKMSGDKMGDKGKTTKKKNSQKKNTKTGKMGSAPDKMGGK